MTNYTYIEKFLSKPSSNMFRELVQMLSNSIYSTDFEHIQVVEISRVLSIYKCKHR